MRFFYYEPPFCFVFVFVCLLLARVASVKSWVAREQQQQCSYWRFRTVWLGALNVGFTLAVVVGDAVSAASYASQLHKAFCKFGSQVKGSTLA